WVRDAVEQQARAAHVRDSHFAVGIELASPLHGVEQKLTESQSDCIPHVVGKVGFELHQKGLDTFGSLARAWNQQLHPMWLSGDDFDGRRSALLEGPLC